MYHESIEEGLTIACIFPLRLHNPLLINQTQILRLDIPERLAKRVDPEVIRFNRVSHSNMAAGTLVVVSVLAQPSDTCRRVKFTERSLVQWVREGWNPDLFLQELFGRPLMGWAP